MAEAWVVHVAKTTGRVNPFLVKYIIRRRLFEWDTRAVSKDGRVILAKDAVNTCNEFADFLLDNRQLIPEWFPVDDARKQFAATYPFSPGAALSI